MVAWAVLAEASFGYLMGGLLVAGFSLPFIIVPLTTTIVGAAPVGTGGVVGGLFDSVRQVGGALRSAVRAGAPPPRGAEAVLAVAAVVLAGVGVVQCSQAPGGML
ncbi:hypothetical protein AB0J28_27810 [Streptosporangium canum]|uniref:hypothetical protein n=1 Tax=Streptosporangium canum TaxID=324952 RepID=UPI00342E8F3B